MTRYMEKLNVRNEKNYAMLNINEVYIELDGKMQVLVTGVTDLRRKIILMISNSASDIYSLNQN